MAMPLRERRTDSFTSRADKLRFLLQAPEGSLVTLKGGYWEAQAADFSLAGFRTAPDLATRSDQPGYLFIDANSDPTGAIHEASSSRCPVRGLVTAVRPPRFGPERYLSRIADRVARMGLVEYGQFEVNGLGRWLDDLRRVPRDAPPAAGLAGWLRTLRRGRYPRLAFYGPPGHRELPGLQLAAAEAASMATLPKAPETEQIWFRRRGALVLRMVVPDGGDQSFFLRVATNPEVDEVLGGNQEFVNRLLAASGLPGSVRQLIPRQYGHRRAGGAELYLEQGCNGQMAWTLESDPGIRASVDRQLHAFSADLQRGTGHSEELSGDRLTRWISDFLGPLPERLERVGLEASVMAGLVSQLRRIMEGRSWWLAPAHGDFGTGNALSLPDGQLTGIIDWDTHAEDDLAGIDWCDHRLKALRFETEQWADRLALLIDHTTRHGRLAPAHQGFGKEDFGLDREAMVLLPCLGYLRILTREARYPASFRRPADYYRRWLDTVGGYLAVAPGRDPDQAAGP